jgi:hypothetical protein
MSTRFPGSWACLSRKNTSDVQVAARVCVGYKWAAESAYMCAGIWSPQISSTDAALTQSGA